MLSYKCAPKVMEIIGNHVTNSTYYNFYVILVTWLSPYKGPESFSSGV